MRIMDEEGCYWTEGKDFGFWSKFKQLSTEKRDFFFVKAIILYLLMRVECMKPTILASRSKQ